MEKSLAGKCHHHQFWFVIVTSFIFLFLLYCRYSAINGGGINSYSLTLSTINFANSLYPGKSLPSSNFNETVIHPPSITSNHTTSQVSMTSNNTLNEIKSSNTTTTDSCSGRYIYVHDLPRRFNDFFLENCKSLLKWSDMCPYVTNYGLGPLAEDSENIFSNSASWFETNQFMLGVIFHNRMKRYDCLTSNSSLASAIFVPFYAGLEVGRNLWYVNTTVRDAVPLDLCRWLIKKSEWERMWGRDHFLVSGRIAWDFHRMTDNESDWGNNLMQLPASKNMTMLAIEASIWNNDFAIPYPTYFHPSSDGQIHRWQNRMRREKRRYLFSFAGAPRPAMEDSIRSDIIHQCISAGGKCKLLDCSAAAGSKCNSAVGVMRIFWDSVFCLQPPGDSYTRRSSFDSILAGCIPVFFHSHSAYRQYVWHLPKNFTKYSVFIPVDDVKNGRVEIEKVLLGISREHVVAMREEVIRLIPRVIYADPRGRLERIEDAFDIAVKGVLEGIESIRRDMLEGRRDRFVFGEKSGWK